MSGITWTQFIVGMGGLMLCYYIYLFFRFGRNAERKEMNEQSGRNEYEPPYDPDGGITDEMFQKAELLINELTENIHNIRDNRELLMLKLRAALLGYPELNVPAFRVGINNRISMVLEEVAETPLTEAEIEGLWE